MDNDRNEKMVMIENIVADLIEVKYDDESITHDPQVSVDFPKMTTKSIDFHGVEHFDFIIYPLLIDVANELKANEKKFYATIFEGPKFQNQIKLLKHSSICLFEAENFKVRLSI